VSIYEDVFKPQSFDEYVGQEKAKAIIEVMTDAAEAEERYYPNFLLTGTAGLGKTSLAKLIVGPLSHRFIDGTLANSVLDELRNFVIIDEIHNMKPEACDKMNLMIDNQKIIVMGCTTNPGALPGPFRSRFQIINLVPYTEQQLTQIMRNVVERKGSLEIADEYLEQIAVRGRETPRTVLKYLSFFIDLMVTRKEDIASQQTLNDSFEMLGVDERGLLDIDRQYLDALPLSTPVGIGYLTAVLAQDKETIEQEIEPYLLHLGLIDRTPKGRVRISDEDADIDHQVEELFTESWLPSI